MTTAWCQDGQQRSHCSLQEKHQGQTEILQEVQGLGSRRLVQCYFILFLDLWPGNSPDLNPIENLWSILKKKVDKLKPTNCDQLRALIRQEWMAISQDLAQKMISSMPEQTAEVMKKGQHCKY